MILQPIVNIAEICARKGLKEVIISPGSRSAPLTLAFVRHPEITTRIISDERSAGFIALGMAMANQAPVALVCTSGTAGANYYPAIAEAYFQQIPLVIFTADRPPEWINQQDGQAIFQDNIYGKHVKKHFKLPVDYQNKDAIWHFERSISEAINTAIAYPPGPVHINVPIREPFYPKLGETMAFDLNVKIIDEIASEYTLNDQTLTQLQKEWNSYNNQLIIGGQDFYNQEQLETIACFSKKFNIPVLADIIANLNDTSISHIDQILMDGPGSNTHLKPDLVVTFGKSILSKNLKLFLRAHKPAHWHIQKAGDVADPFQSLEKIISVKPTWFFNHFEPNVSNSTFIETWKKEESVSAKCLAHFFNDHNFSEFEAVKLALENLPEGTNLHLANSMVVRYANFVGLKHKKNVKVYANRGTSGIEGSTSTAIGNALADKNLVVLITGDMAFQYDRNAFWHNYLPDNLRIIVLNNHSGGIFALIDGPSELPESEEYFETKQPLFAENIAKDFGLKYYLANDRNTANFQLRDFFKMDGGAKVLEIETDKTINKAVFKAFKQIKQRKFR